MSDWEKKMVVPTRLVGNKAYEVLDSVIGQMSDGMWENNSYYNKYWMNCEIDKKDNSIIVNKGWGSGFRDMDEKQVREFFIRKIRAILKHYLKCVEECGDRYGWSEDNCVFLNHRETISVEEVRTFIKELKAVDKPKKV